MPERDVAVAVDPNAELFERLERELWHVGVLNVPIQDEDVHGDDDGLAGVFACV